MNRPSNWFCLEAKNTLNVSRTFDRDVVAEGTAGPFQKGNLFILFIFILLQKGLI
jgi:hypothetical protein